MRIISSSVYVALTALLLKFTPAFAVEVAAVSTVVRDAVATVNYTPDPPSTLTPSWDGWVVKVDELVAAVAAGVSHQAKAADIAYEALRAGLDTELVLTLVELQSRFNERYQSSNGNVGLLGLAPQVQQRYGNAANTLLQGKYNLRLGCTLLRYYLDLSKGDLNRALDLFLKTAASGTRLEAAAVWAAYEPRSNSLRSLNPSGPR